VRFPSLIRLMDKVRAWANVFGHELRRSWMLRTSMLLMILGAFSLYLFNIGIGGMILLAGFFIYLYYRSKKETLFL